MHDHNFGRRAGRPDSRRTAMFDVALVLVVLTALVPLLWPLIKAYGPWGLGIQSVLVLPLLVRRRFPLTVLGLMLVSTIALFALGRFAPGLLATLFQPTSSWVVLAVPFATYSAVVYGADRRRAWLMIGIITLVAARPDSPSIELGIAAVLLVALPALLGSYVASLSERAERAEREQHRLAERARVEERVRLASEMHDVVTHRVSLMVLRAGALGVTTTDDATREAAEELRAAGCQALEELRDLIGVLRSAPEEVAEHAAVVRAGGQAPAPDIAELLAESRSVGVPVELDVEGRPSLASPVVGRTTYRIVQEALTNVRKHAPGAPARVILRYEPDRVFLAVRNGAPREPVDTVLTASGSGTGLLGLRHRVELVSGSLRAQPTADGGFEVEAVLPAYVPTTAEPTGWSPAEPARDRA